MTRTSSKPDSVPVAPDSVRVWRGFRLSSLPQEDFFRKLGSFFIPGTVQIQSPVGLTAYMPSVLPREKPAAAPDEIALVFYKVQDAYDEAKKTVGGRAYSDLHGVAFDLKRSLSGFPKLFKGELVPDERYYLFDEHVDWQHGVVNVFVGVQSGNKEFHSDVAGWLKEVQQRGGPDGAIASASRDYVVYWEHWPDAAAAKGSRISELGGFVEQVYLEEIAPQVLNQGLWEHYPGVKVEGGESFNFKFKRSCES